MAKKKLSPLGEARFAQIFGDMPKKTQKRAKNIIMQIEDAILTDKQKRLRR